MKISLAFLVALALSGVVNVRSIPLSRTDILSSKHSRSAQSLDDDFADFLALVPVDEVTEIVLQYVTEDDEVQTVIEYIQSDGFKELVQKGESIEDLINFYDYLQESGVNVYKAVNALHEFMGLPPLVPGVSSRNAKITGGMAGLIADIKAILPLEDIKALYHKKLETSPEFAKLVERFKSPRFQEIIDALRANVEFQKMLHFAKEHGVDVKAITDLLSSLLGLEFPSRHSRSARSLEDDFADFYALVPVDEIADIVLQYVSEDAEVQTAVEYIQSDGFKELVQKAESMDDLINFYDYLQESGVNVYEAVNALHELMGLPPLIPGGSSRNAKITGGMAGLIADIKAILPLEDIKALYHKKLETSPDFAELVKRLSSQRFQEIIDALRANVEFQKMLHFAKEHGVDVKAITDLLSSLLGLEFPSSHSRSARSLEDDFADFFALVPVDEVTEIVMQYVTEDDEVQTVIEYIQSDGFKELVQKGESIEDLINFYDYLQESGVNVYKAVNALHEFMGLPPLVPGVSSRNAKITGGMAGLIADIKAILPLEDIKALYHKKLESSPEFAKLVERFKSPRFQEIIDALRANVEFQKMLHFAKEHGVDVKAITDLLSSLLGLEFPSRHSRSKLVPFTTSRGDLKDDLEDFIALLPVDQITEIVLDYLTNDEEILETLEYLQSPDFHNIVQEVEAMKEAKDVLAFLEESGLDAYAFLNSIHEILGIPPFQPYALSNKSAFKATGGLAGLIADIKAILPLEKIKALYYEKLENSPAFAKLIKRLSSPEFQEFVDAVIVKEEARVIINKLKEHGVDLKAITDLLSTLLGLHFPEPSRAMIARSDLKDDLEDFIALLPVDQITEIVLDYLTNDEEILETLEYLQSPDFHNIVQEVEAMKEAKDVLAFLEESGLDAYAFLNSIHEILGIPPFQPHVLSNKRVLRATGGLAGLIADIKAILPLEKIKALYYEKLENSPAFAKLIKRLSSPEFQEFVDAVIVKEEARVIINKLKEHGVDLKAITDLLSTLLGLHFPEPSRAMIARSDLKDDLEDFIALLPVDQITEIVLDYLTNDEEILQTLEYLQSPDFHNIVQEVEAMKEAKDVLAFLEESGLDAYAFLNSIHEILGIPPFQPYALSNKRAFKATGGLAGLIADIKAILPLEKIKALYYEKLENSPAFAKLIKRLSSPEFDEFVNAVIVKEEARVIINKLKDHGVDLKAVTDLLSAILGLHFPDPADRVRRTLDRSNHQLLEDLDDFMALLPLEEIMEVSLDYIFNDPEVQNAAVYVASPEFKKIAIPAQQNREFRRFIHYLDGTGLPASFYINKINGFLGFPAVEPPSPSKRSKISGSGIRGMMDEIEALLPHEEIKKLFEYKKQNSKAFQFMIERLEAKEFQTIVDELSLNEDFRFLGIQAASMGIDLNAIADLLSRAFGIENHHPLGRSARSLDDDLQEFVDLVPAKKIRKIVARYYLFDAEFKTAVAYVKSENFAQLITDLHQIPEYNDLLKSLESAGLDVQLYIAKIHKLINYKEFRFTMNERKTNGMAGFVAEIKATLPVADIKALYEHKLETSQDFAGLVELISSAKFQAVTDALFANTIFQDILHRVQAHGIDLQAVSEFFLAVFGITTPPGVIDFFALL